MTVEELKTALLGKQFSQPVVLADHMVVQDIDQFLRIRFIECDLWKKE
ncbi:hypothetical protein [Sphingobacterium haloxyli]|nr:hypothetical protein [Sphingobacterium haloxyli]